MTAYDDIAKGDRGEPEPSAAVGCVPEARRGWLGLHKAAPYPEPRDRRQLKTAKKDNLPACSEAPSPTVIKLAADPAPTAPRTLRTPRCAASSFAHLSILARCASCRAVAAAAFSHPFLFPT